MMPASSSATVSGIGRGRRILVVDDDPEARASLAMLLELDGFEVACAADGRQALARAAEFAPALILLDLGLPELGGEEVARRLRGGGSTARIVALTGAGAPACMPALFDAWVTKPARVEELIAGLV